jgi:hemolysin activation/secretion protein
MGSIFQRTVGAFLLSSGAAVSIAGGVIALSSGLAFGATASSVAIVEGTEFVVGDVEIVYAPGTKASIAASDLEQIQVELVRETSGLLVSPDGKSGPREFVSLASLGASNTARLDTSGLRAVMESVHAAFSARTGMKAYVVPDATQILLRGAGEDYRGGATGLRFVVYPSRVRASEPAESAVTAPVPAATPAAEPQRLTPAQDATPAQDVTPPPTILPRPPETRSAAPASAPATASVQDPVPAVDSTAGVESAPADENAHAASAAPVRVVAAPTDERVYEPADLPMSSVTLDDDIDGATPFTMTGFEFTYPRQHPDLPSAESLQDITVRLLRVPGGLVARQGEGQLVRIGDLGANGSERLYFSAFRASMDAVLRSFRDQSIVGVLVTPDPESGIGPDEIEGYYDERSEFGITTLPLLIYVPQVTKIKTIASGDRIPTESRLDSPKHRSIARGSPLQPYDGGDGARKDLLRFEPLNTYAFRKSRHPGRRVDVAIADASIPGEDGTQGNAEVQYLVQEIKPWTIYAQVSNTGTEQTDEWRERIGLVHNQLFGFDDILSMDYITSNLRESHAFVGSYDVPLSADGRLRGKIVGDWSKYIASDVGVADEQFRGRSFSIGGELRYNFIQVDDLFIDAYAGGRYRDIEVINTGLLNGLGEEQVFVADIGLRAERRRANLSFNAEVGVEFSLNDLTAASQADLQLLGRLNPDEQWTLLHWDVDFSFFLDGVGLQSNTKPRYIHEIATRFSGQYAFNDRLIPNYQAVGGGLYTARGYDESLVAGDSGVFGSVEYRFHLPRALPAASPPTIFGRPFRFATDSDDLPPDWDLILKAFVDAGTVSNSRQLGFESDESLLSTGLGAEIQIANNFSFRTDWGVVLDEVGSDTPSPTTVGTQRWHFVFTLLY